MWPFDSQAKNGAQGRIRHRLAGLALLVVVAIGAVIALSFTSPWRLIELRSFDYLTTIGQPPMPQDGPVIVAIDEPSLSEIPHQWPWPRALHAQLIEKLREAGAKAIGLDIIFAEPAVDPANDDALQAALGPDVVLAGDETLINTPQADQLIRTEPLPRFVEAGAHVGIASVGLDGDGVLRGMPAYEDSFAAEIARAAGQPLVLRESGAMLQAFGPARTYPTVSYYQALDPQNFLPEGYFKGRTVLVGLSLQTAPDVRAGAPDTFATPYTVHTSRLVAGVEVQATLVDNLSHGLAIADTGTALRMLLIVLGAVVGAAVVYRDTNWITVLWGAASVAVAVGLAYATVRYGRIFASPVGPVLSYLTVVIGQSGLDYAAERRTRRQVTRAFGQYLSPAMVERLANDPSQLKLGGETRNLSILFCDVRGFTTIAERMKNDPQQLTTLINRLLTPLSDEILACGGTIDKYIGDCVMAFWNAPIDDPDHAAHSVEAALRMLEAMDRFNATLQAELATRGEEPYGLRIGVGINTGDCVVGNMGSVSRFDYSALGDSVNLASRLEGESKSVAVPLLLGEETARQAASRFCMVELDRIQVKGRSVASPVFTALKTAPPDDVLADHARFLEAKYAGTLTADDAAFDRLTAALPQFSAYYATMRARIAVSA